MKSYNFQNHIHQFGVWAAARAASISRLTNVEVETIFNAVEIEKRVQELQHTKKITPAKYKKWHILLCNEIIALVPKKINKKKRVISFGIASKLVSIYLKTTIVLPGLGKTPLACIAYPPIDRFLIRSLNNFCDTNYNTNWSTFNINDYLIIIEKLQQTFKGCLWHAEVLWILE
jgi:hypothetical protein